MPKKAKSFEDALTALEQTVVQLEAKDIPLNKAMSLFEQGMILAHECENHLLKAEQKVQQLVKKPDGQLDTEPFTIGSE